MIIVYDKAENEFKSNGLAVLMPEKCEITETLNEKWELTMEHPYDEYGKWKYLQVGNIVRVPVPRCPVPSAYMSTLNTKKIPFIYHANSDQYIMKTASTSGTKLELVPKGKPVLMIEYGTTWLKVRSYFGTEGYVRLSYFTQSNDDIDAAMEYIYPSNAELCAADRLSDQPFRITNVEMSMDNVKVSGMHIFYDCAYLWHTYEYWPAGSLHLAIKTFNVGDYPTGVKHEFKTDIHSSISKSLAPSADPFELVSAMIGSGGIAELFEGYVHRDRFETYILKRRGRDTEIVLNEGLDISGITYTIDITDTYTKVVPFGRKSNGTVFTTDLATNEIVPTGTNYGAFVSTERKYAYGPARAKYFEAEFSKIGDKDSDGTTTITENIAVFNMQRQAYDMLANGCDLPAVSVDIDFVDLSSTEEYKDYAGLQELWLGDNVTVKVPSIGVDVTVRMTGYTYDCVAEEYTKINLGTDIYPIE